MSDGFLLRALAVADADELVIYPDSAVLRKQLPLFLGAAVTPNSLACCCYSFALTNDTGSRLYVYVLKEGSVSFCAITAQEQQTPLFALLASLIQLAAADASAGLLERAVQLLCDALLPPSPGTALRIVLPALHGSCRLECELGGRRDHLRNGYREVSRRAEPGGGGLRFSHVLRERHRHRVGFPLGLQRDGKGQQYAARRHTRRDRGQRRARLRRYNQAHRVQRGGGDVGDAAGEAEDHTDGECRWRRRG